MTSNSLVTHLCSDTPMFRLFNHWGEGGGWHHQCYAHTHCRYNQSMCAPPSGRRTGPPTPSPLSPRQTLPPPPPHKCYIGFLFFYFLYLKTKMFNVFIVCTIGDTTQKVEQKKIALFYRKLHKKVFRPCCSCPKLQCQLLCQ